MGGDIRVVYHSVTSSAMNSTTSSLNLSFLLMRPSILFTAPTTLNLSGAHRSRPSFSFSEYECGPSWNCGRLVDSLRMCRPRKLLPLFVACPFAVVAVGGGPILAGSHVCEPPGVRMPEAGLDCPLGVRRPGLDQPPPRAGEGLRDKDIGWFGVPAGRGRQVSGFALRVIFPL